MIQKNISLIHSIYDRLTLSVTSTAVIVCHWQSQLSWFGDAIGWHSLRANTSLGWEKVNQLMSTPSVRTILVSPI